jgi:hypothetical protein
MGRVLEFVHRITHQRVALDDEPGAGLAHPLLGLREQVERNLGPLVPVRPRGTGAEQARTRHAVQDGQHAQRHTAPQRFTRRPVRCALRIRGSIHRDRDRPTLIRFRLPELRHDRRLLEVPSVLVFEVSVLRRPEHMQGRRCPSEPTSGHEYSGAVDSIRRQVGEREGRRGTDDVVVATMAGGHAMLGLPPGLLYPQGGPTLPTRK